MTSETPNADDAALPLDSPDFAAQLAARAKQRLADQQATAAAAAAAAVAPTTTRESSVSGVAHFGAPASTTPPAAPVPAQPVVSAQPVAGPTPPAPAVGQPAGASQPTPPQPAPVQQAPIQPAPVQPNPAPLAPVQQAPAQPAPVRQPVAPQAPEAPQVQAQPTVAAPQPTPVGAAVGATAPGAAVTPAAAAQQVSGAAAAQPLSPAGQAGEPAALPTSEDDEYDVVNPKLRSLIEWAVVVAGALAVALVIKSFLLQAYFIPSPSMEQTLVEDDRVLVNKLSKSANRGDVMVFKRAQPEPGQPADLIKRVIGLEGETVEARGGDVYIDGKLLLEDTYLQAGISTAGPMWSDGCANERGDGNSCTVPEGRLFMMGDNRPNSSDSRVFGPISTDQLVGRAFLKVWPLGDITAL